MYSYVRVYKYGYTFILSYTRTTYVRAYSYMYMQELYEFILESKTYKLGIKYPYLILIYEKEVLYIEYCCEKFIGG